MLFLVVVVAIFNLVIGKEVTCEKPVSPEHGSLRLLGDRKVNSFALYLCDNGWKLIGVSAAKCLDTGQWTSSPPRCIEEDSLNPDTPTALVVTPAPVPSPPPERKATPGVIEKQDTHNITSTPEHAKEDECFCTYNGQDKTLSAKVNGLPVRYEGKVKKGDKMTISCYDEAKHLVLPNDTSISGTLNFSCDACQTWTDAILPSCGDDRSEITCRELIETDLMKISYTDNLSVGSIANFHCFAPGIRSGVARTQCLQTGEWSHSPPTCQSVIPYFTQTPLSYMRMPTLSDAHLSFEIEISFKPESMNGLILYNGQRTNQGDFISLVLNNAFVEFRFELGSGPAILRSEHPVQMDKWHLVKIGLELKKGVMIVDDQPEVIGDAQGRLSGLDLVEPMYIGSVPDFGAIESNAGASKGFIGCISHYKTGKVNHNLLREAKTFGISACETCTPNPCLHGGVCQEALMFGYNCICLPGFSGRDCEFVGEACYPRVCGEGRCFNRSGGGFDCYCPLRRTGVRCEKGREVPAIELYPEATLTVIRGGSALFQCRVTAVPGIPTPTVEWIRADGSPFTRSTEIVNGGVLRFNRVTGDEEGTYICTAENSDGRVTAQAVLRITGAPTVRIVQTNPYRVRPGEAVRFECSSEGDPIPNVVWRKLRHPLVSYSSTADSDDGKALLEIRRVSQSDAGVYICSARNSAGVTEARIQLIVEDGDTTLPEVTVEDRVITGTVNSSVELRCFVRGTDRDIYLKWTRTDGRALPIHHRLHNGILYLSNVQPDDAGEYSCLGIVEGDIILFTARTRLAIVAPPRIQLNPPRQTVRPGDIVRIHCTATGDQPISIDFSRIGGILPGHIRQSGGYLTFNGITADDAGRYLCTAVNAAGKVQGVAEVVMNEDTQVDYSRKEETTFIGSNIQLKCTFSGSPPPQIDWSKDGGPLPRNSRVINNELWIRDVRSENAGRYICTTTNTQGRTRDFVILNVRGINREIEIVLFSVTDPCKNGGTYIGSGNTYKCSCPLRYKGLNCEETSLFADRVSFEGNGYIALDSELMPHTVNDQTEVISFSFSTTGSNGLLLFHGQKPETDGKGQDYLAAAVVDGYLEFSYELGSGPSQIKSPVKVNDGKPHTVILHRIGRHGRLVLLDGYQRFGVSQGHIQILNTVGDIYFGGVPNHQLMTGNKYPQGLIGCLWDIRIEAFGPINLYETAKHGANVDDCEEDEASGKLLGELEETFMQK